MAISGIGPGGAVMTDPAERAGTATDIAPAGMARRWIELNIHDRAAIRVAEDAPTASILRDMFAPFRAQGLERHDLTITAELEPMPGASHNEDEYRHTDSSLYLTAMKVQLVVDGDGYRLHGTRELLTSTLPLLDRILVGRDVAMIHAATFDYRGHGVAMPAWGGVGKTSTIAKLLRVDGVAFMGDDWAFMAGDGRLLGYAKPMFIKPHHRPIYPHLFARRRKPLVPSALSRPIAELTTLVHPLVTQYPRLAALSRRWSPEHMMVAPEAALPNATISTTAPLAAAIFVERYDGSTVSLQEKDNGWMVSRLIGNFHAELARHSRDLITALAATGLMPAEWFFSEKGAVLARALDDKPAFLLRVPATFSADQASDVIVERLLETLVRSGIG
jgi:hypothetical protein